QLILNLPHMEAAIKFSDWRVNAAAKDNLFEPPANLPHRQVDQGFLYTLFASSIRFALGTTE
ncbi:MAG TPA: hypothetical protein VIH42_01320, partial [Thermoguttaceae bacterium]